MIKIKDLTVLLPGFALRGINLNLEKGDYFILVGPSASGKTVLLETIAGLHNVTSGQIWIDDREITSLESEKRNVGIVYQDCALFPHLTVKENIVFGLKVRHKDSAHIARELNRIVKLLDIEQLLPRKPVHLSGGEKQKVALARALMPNPEILLLDEPLVALDPQSKENLRQELTILHGQLGVTILHVTHDFEEAVIMGKHIAVIGDGTIKQVGLPDQIFSHPNSEFVARFTMAENVFPGIARKNSSGSATFVVEGASLVTETDMVGPCLAAIRPENILISTTRPADIYANVYMGVISRIVNKGSIVNITVNLPPAMICLLTRHTFDQMNLNTGQSIYLTVLPASVHLFQA
jgi:ABC-type Fe3+/spermidine/putrescine transport system ATPase subunit